MRLQNWEKYHYFPLSYDFCISDFPFFPPVSPWSLSQMMGTCALWPCWLNPSHPPFEGLWWAGTATTRQRPQQPLQPFGSGPQALVVTNISSTGLQSPARKTFCTAIIINIASPRKPHLKSNFSIKLSSIWNRPIYQQDKDVQSYWWLELWVA